jgi:mRNA-degrading endonuclease toxin of MazEF toxin-antitoxin module
MTSDAGAAAPFASASLNVGDLVVLPFPFSDLSQAKNRPAVVLTLPDQHGDFVALAVKSQPGHACAVPLDGTGLSQGSLPKASWIGADKVYTFHTSVVSKRIAKVRPAVMRAALVLTCPVIGCCVSAA